MKRNVIVLLLILISMYSTAQRMRTICGECIYPAPSNVSEDEAKKTAIFRAKIQALADEFGTDLNLAEVALISPIALLISHNYGLLFHAELPLFQN